MHQKLLGLGIFEQSYKYGLNKDTVNSLMAANTLYSYIPDLYMLLIHPTLLK